MPNTQRKSWTSRIGFILASVGAAVGLGAIWKFPYMAGSNGGSAFLFPYIVLTLTVGLTLLIAEITLGHLGRGGIVTTYRKIAGSKWVPVGYLGVITGFLVMTFYSAIGGWTLAYFCEALTGSGLITDQAQLGAHFGELTSNPIMALGYQWLFLLLNGLIVAFDVTRGIERVSKVLMPLLFVMMLVLIGRGLTLPGAWEGVRFLFEPDWNQFTAQSLLNAMGFAFFSLSVGSASQMNYGSYLSKKVNLPGSVTWIVFLAIIASLLGGLMIMPAVFAFGLSPDAGPGLTFATMPAVFAQLPFGHFFAITFYVCLYVAALTSAISIFEMSVQYLNDEWKMPRPVAVLLIFLTLAMLGILCALSFGPLANVKIAGMSFFNFFDYLTSNIGMPIGALGIGIVVAWLARPMAEAQLQLVHPYPKNFLRLFHLIAGVLAPVLIIVVMLHGIGIIDFGN